MFLCILDMYLTVRDYRTSVVSKLLLKGFQDQEHHHEKKSSEARERVCSAPNWVSLRKLQHHKYINFQKQHPWSSKQRFYIRALIWHFKIWGFNKTLINHVQRDYSTGVYLGKAIQYREVTYLVLLIKPTKNNYQMLSLIWKCLSEKRTKDRLWKEAGHRRREPKCILTIHSPMWAVPQY